MFHTTWIRNLWRTRPSVLRKPRKRQHRLAVENLEDRSVPSVTSVLELDANVVTTATHDWDQVFADNQTEPPGTTSGALASSFVTDTVNSTSDDIFTGGGSKDTQGIQNGPWLFADSKPQAKNDITHAYAAMYTDPSNGHVILYAGLDRFDNSGDATAGFWFFTNPIGLSTNNPPSSGAPFTGTHADGDILLVSDFTQGGSVSTIQVYRWTGNDNTGSLVPVTTPAGTTFAIVNGAAITVPWSFTDKSHNSGPSAGEFLEEGVDLSALGLGSCFANFLAETRSSQSPTATLSDFVIGSFDTCRLDLPNTATVSADGIDPITSNQALITVLDGHDGGQATPQGASIGGDAGAGRLSAMRPLLGAGSDAAPMGLSAGEATVFGFDSNNSLDWNWSTGSSGGDEGPAEYLPLASDEEVTPARSDIENTAMELEAGQSDLVNLTYELLGVVRDADVDLLGAVAL